MPFKAEKMNYPYDALEPFMKEEFVKLHYEKHHIGYQNKLNEIIEGTEIDEQFDHNVINLIKNYQKIENDELKTHIREYGGGLANHDFFWKCMKKNTSYIPNSLLIKGIFHDWLDMDAFEEDFINKCMEVFGSGWVFLVRKKDSKKLKFIKLFNQDNPWFLNFIPIFGIDLWEHSYYLQYNADRLSYVKNFLKNIDWDFAEKQFLTKIRRNPEKW